MQNTRHRMFPTDEDLADAWRESYVNSDKGGSYPEASVENEHLDTNIIIMK
jgi:hypothetical protein